MLQRVFTADLDPARLAVPRGEAGAAMKIGMVCPYSWDVPGGVQQHIRDLAEALIDEGHEVSVISPADDDTPLPPYVVGAGRAVPVPYNGSVARLSFGFLSVSRVRRWLNQGGFDVLHVHEPEHPEPVAAGLLGGLGPDRGHRAHRDTALPGAAGHLPGAAHRAGEDQRPDRGLRGGPDHAGRAHRRRRGGHPQRRGHPPLPQGRAAARLARPRRRHRLPGPAGRAAQGPGRPAQGVRDPRPGAARAAAAGGRPGRGRRGGAAPGARRTAGPGRAARAGQRGGQGPRAALGRRVLLAEHRRRVVRHRHRRGDGGRACPSWPATSTRSARCWTAARRGSCSPPGTPATWPGRPGACWTTRRAAPSCRPPRWPRSPSTTGRSWPATCSASTRRSCSAAPAWPWPQDGGDFP